MKSLTTLLLFALLPFALSAQKGWLPGTVELSNGTRLTGTIQDLSWQDNIKSVTFRPEGTLSETRYTVEEMKSFQTQNRYFQVAEITINNSPRETANLRTRNELTQETVRAALQRLAEGPLSLFEYTAPRGDVHYFVADESGVLTYLSYEVFLKSDPDGRQSSQESKEYIFQLNELLSKSCPSLLNSVSSLKYQRLSMVRLFRDYYDCIGFTSSEIYEKGKPSLAGGISAGLNFVSPYAEIFGDYPQTLEFTVPGGIGFSAGVFGRFYPNKHKRFGLRGELRYHQLSTQANEELPTSNDFVFAGYEMTHDEQFIVGKLGAELEVLNQRFPLLLTVGLSFNQALTYKEFRRRYSRVTSSGFETSLMISPDYSGTLFLGPHTGLLMQFDQLSVGLEANYYSHRWVNQMQMRTVRLDLMVFYAL